MAKKVASIRQKEMTPWQHRLLVRDAVLASLSLQSEAKQLPERIQRRKLFEAFCRLQQHRKYERWLGSLYFEKQAEACVSKQLEDVLFSLGAFGLVTVENHDYRFLKVTPDARNAMRTQLESRSTTTDLEALKGMSNEFAGLVE